MVSSSSRTPHRAQHPGHHLCDVDGQAEILDLDAHVLADHLATIVEWLPVEAPPGAIVDVGCGTGAGTLALLDTFPEAFVTAVDTSGSHLERLRQKALARGVDARVTTVRADLDDPTWPDLGAPDLVWASASMHHLADPDSALRKVHDTLVRGGLFVVVELAGFPRFLPDNAPEDRPGLEDRCHVASDRYHGEHVPHRSADWGTKLTSAGFTVEATRTLTLNIPGSSDEAVGAYALGALRRLRSSVADALPPEDLAALDRLLDTDGPHSVVRRDDLAVRSERTVWAARRIRRSD